MRRESDAPLGDERFRMLAEYASEIFVEIGPGGRCTYVSPSVRDLLGYEPEEFVAQAPLDLIHPDDAREVARIFAGLLRLEGRASSVHRARHRDGSWRWMHDNARSFPDADGRLRIVAVGRDVTEQKAAEAALERQLELQAVVATLSREFLALGWDEIDAGIHQHLGTLAEHAGAERTRIVVMNPNDAGVMDSYEWSAPGHDQLFRPLAEVPAQPYPWLARQLAKGEVVQIPLVRGLPDEAARERSELMARGVASTLMIPVSAGASTRGFVVFGSVQEGRHWSPQEVTLLRLAGQIFAGAIRRKHAEAALRESDERFRTIAQHAVELITEVDAEGRYIYVSPSVEACLGHTPECVLGRRVSEFMHPDEYDGLAGVYAAAFREQSEVRSMHRLRHRDGSWRWFESSGRASRAANGELRFGGIARDVTERKASEEAIERQLDVEKRIAALSRRFLALNNDELDAALVEALEEAAGLAGADQCCLFAPGGKGSRHPVLYQWPAEATSRYRSGRRPWAQERLLRGEVIALESVADLPAEAELERRSLVERGIQSVLMIPLRSGADTLGALVFETTRARRTWREHEVTLLRLIGEIFASAIRRRSTEAALRESESKLMQAQKLEAVGRLAGGIAHDFNNLLTVILGFSRPILRELPESEPMHGDVKEIHDAAERAAALTRQLLTFSRRQIAASQPVDLNLTLSGLQPLLRRLVGEDVDVAIELAPDLPTVWGDPHQFEQVVVNLAVNARDAMADGGTLKVETRVRDVDAEQSRKLGLPGPGPTVLLRVSDTGHGMDPSTQARIFDPFFTTKDPGKGTGLGLSIAYGVVEQARGAIAVEGSPGKGTTFQIWLPICEDEAGPQAATPKWQPVGGTETVLLAEDDPAVSRLTRRILEEHGYRVLAAVDGQAALELAERTDEAIHALVSDVVMPHLGGYELARRLRETRPTLAVMFLSGYPEDEGLRDAGPPGDSRFLAKPFEAEGLLAGLRELLSA